MSVNSLYFNNKKAKLLGFECSLITVMFYSVACSYFSNMKTGGPTSLTASSLLARTVW